MATRLVHSGRVRSLSNASETWVLPEADPEPNIPVKVIYQGKAPLRPVSAGKQEGKREEAKPG